MAVGLRGDSEPPHTTTSASPDLISRSPSATACAPAAHAVAMAELCPLMPCSMAIRAAAMLGRNPGCR
ncbi:hypothetical protein BJ982_005274 [Sphaerisporangium siamense]|uniref:Uncharacterized protein n=1 Tax=Sphaerisporangium siamense TaxID=795645 RepID=A0A7W7DCX6_9ACTN|nr:hypothetical protein [Sphaerisporangium siamense]MBB4703730.1 hypothetical protein [Sphaerisporangium siamense]